MAAIFNFRFNGTGEIAGHSLGNLILTALCQLEEDGFLGALKQGSELLGIRGRVLPTTVENVTLRAEFTDGSAVEGEASIAPVRRLIHRLALEPKGAALLPEAIARSRGRVVLVMNLMTEPGETDGYTAVDHVLAIRRHVPGLHIDDVLLNTAALPQDMIDSYVAQGAPPVPSDADLLRALGYRLLERDLLGAGPKIRHDADNLARAILALAAEAQG